MSVVTGHIALTEPCITACPHHMFTKQVKNKTFRSLPHGICTGRSFKICTALHHCSPTAIPSKACRVLEAIHRCMCVGKLLTPCVQSLQLNDTYLIFPQIIVTGHASRVFYKMYTQKPRQVASSILSMLSFNASTSVCWNWH